MAKKKTITVRRVDERGVMLESDVPVLHECGAWCVTQEKYDDGGSAGFVLVHRESGIAPCCYIFARLSRAKKACDVFDAEVPKSWLSQHDPQTPLDRAVAGARTSFCYTLCERINWT